MKDNSLSLVELIRRAQSAREQAVGSMTKAQTAQTGWDRLIPGLRGAILPPLRRSADALSAENREQASALSSLMKTLNRRIGALQRLPSGLDMDLRVLRWQIVIPLLYIYAEVRDFIRRFWREILGFLGILIIVYLAIVTLPLLFDALFELWNSLRQNP